MSFSARLPAEVCLVQEDPVSDRSLWTWKARLAGDASVRGLPLYEYGDDILVRMAVTPDHVWPNKKEHQSFLSGPRKARLQMSRWLADRQLFPKF